MNISSSNKDLSMSISSSNKDLSMNISSSNKDLSMNISSSNKDLSMSLYLLVLWACFCRPICSRPGPNASQQFSFNIYSSLRLL